jgi:hypothetical protein
LRRARQIDPRRLHDEIAPAEILAGRDVGVGQEKTPSDVVEPERADHARVSVEVGRRRAFPIVGVVKDHRLGDGGKVHLIAGNRKLQRRSRRRHHEHGAGLCPIGGAHADGAVQRRRNAAEARRVEAAAAPFPPSSRRRIVARRASDSVFPIAQPLTVRVPVTVVAVDRGAIALAARAAGDESLVAGDDLTEHIPRQPVIPGTGDRH